jgi:hypothetical protein
LNKYDYVAMLDEPPRLFLSYGFHDALEASRVVAPRPYGVRVSGLVGRDRLHPSRSQNPDHCHPTEARSRPTTAVEAATPATLEAVRFARSLIGMLAARLERLCGYAAQSPGIKDALERADTDPISRIEAAIISLLHSVLTKAIA